MKKFLSVLFVLVFCVAFTICVSATDGTEEAFDFGDWFANTFKVETILAFLSSIASALMTIITTKILKAFDKTKDINTAQINSTIESAISTKLNEEAPKLVQPYVDRINELTTNIGAIIKGLALLQDGTPQSKLAMYDLIEKTGIVDKSTIEICKNDIKEEIKKQKDTKHQVTVHLIKRRAKGRKCCCT